MKDEIVIDGETYIRKSLTGYKFVGTERYDRITHEKLVKQISKVISFKQRRLPESMIPEGNLVVMDSANISMIVAKSDKAKILLANFIEFDPDYDVNFTKEPELKYNEKCKKGTKVSPEITHMLIGIFDLDKGGSPRFFARDDYPLTAENENWKIVIAPRVDSK